MRPPPVPPGMIPMRLPPMMRPPVSMAQTRLPVRPGMSMRLPPGMPRPPIPPRPPTMMAVHYPSQDPTRMGATGATASLEATDELADT